MQSLVEIWTGVLEKIFLNFVNVFLLFRNYLTLEKDRDPHLNKLESPSTKDALCQVWLKLAQLFLRERVENIEISLQTDGQQTDDGQQAIRKAHFCFQLR